MRRAAGKYWSRALGGLLALCVVVAAVAQAAEPAGAAGTYDEKPVNPPNLRGWNKARNCPQSSDPRGMLRGDVDWNTAVFDAFFNDILFPQFTLCKEADEHGNKGSNVLTTVEDPHDKTVKWRASLLPTCRQEFIKMFVDQAERNANLEPFNHLNTITIQYMRDVALGKNYHPLSRYNATLLISSLHEANSDKPLKATLPALIACLDSIDPVRVASLDGLLKHAKAGSVGAQRPQLIDAMLKIVNEKTPPPGRTADGHDWIRRRAIDVLAALGDPGPNLAVVAALDKILKDNQSSPDLSCSAAMALGSISFHAPESMNATATAFSIGQIAVDAYKAELARAEERKASDVEPAANDNRSRGGVAGPIGAPVRGLGALGGAATAPAGAIGLAGPANGEVFVSIPLLRSQLFDLDRGMKSLASATVGTKHQQFADSVEKNLALLMAACDPAAPDNETLVAQISKAGAGLEAALAGGSGGGRAPAVEKGPGASKEDSFDSEPEKPAAAPAPVAPATKAAPAK